MNTHTHKKEENTRQSISSEKSDKQHGDSTFYFADNRPENTAQRKLKALASDVAHLSQMKNFQEMTDNRPLAKRAGQLKHMQDNYSPRTQQSIQKKVNNTGLPDDLKSGMENLSGLSLDDVNVHRNSDKPAQMQAHAYAQGTDIHLGPGQEKHLPHEAWHVVQQKQGRVKPTLQMKVKVNINDDEGLEKEADEMSAKAMQFVDNRQETVTQRMVDGEGDSNVVQRYVNEFLPLDLVGLDATRDNLISKINDYNQKDRTQDIDAYGIPALDEGYINNQIALLDEIEGIITTWKGTQTEEGYNFGIMEQLLSNVVADKARLNKRRGTQDHHTQVKKVEPGWEKSETGEYMIHSSDRTGLFSRAGSTPPKPTGLYTPMSVRVEGTDMAIRWVPNVRFLNKKEKEGLYADGTTEMGVGLARKFVKKGIINKTQVDVGAIIKKMIAAVRDRSGQIPKGTKLAIGENDCAKWAQNLQRMIREEFEASGIAQEPGVAKTLDVVKDIVPKLGVGHSMYHIYQGTEADCGWHGATVIASDGETSITLEAHISKDITVPEFHMRKGALGFVRDNNTTFDESGFPSDRGIGSKLKHTTPMHESDKSYEDQTDLRKSMGQNLMSSGFAGTDIGRYHAEIELNK